MAAVGQRVNYVMSDGQIRPLDIVKVWDDTRINGLVMLDGTNDDKNIPVSVFTLGKNDKNEPISIESPMPMPMVTQTIAPHSAVPLCSLWVTSVHLDETKTPGTFHFAEEEETAEDNSQDEALTAMGESFQSQMEALTKRVKFLESGQTANTRQAKTAPAKAAAEVAAPDASVPVSDAPPASPATPPASPEQAPKQTTEAKKDGYTV